MLKRGKDIRGKRNFDSVENKGEFHLIVEMDIGRIIPSNGRTRTTEILKS